MEVMSYLRGKTTRMLFDRHPEYRNCIVVKLFYIKVYYLVSVGKVNEETMQEYNQNQGEIGLI